MGFVWYLYKRWLHNFCMFFQENLESIDELGLVAWDSRVTNLDREGIQEQVSRSSSHLCWISEVCALRHVKLELELRKINLLGLSGGWSFIYSRITLELQVSKTYIQLRLVKSLTRNCCDEYAIRPIPFTLIWCNMEGTGNGGHFLCKRKMLLIWFAWRLQCSQLLRKSYYAALSQQT